MYSGPGLLSISGLEQTWAWLVGHVDPKDVKSTEWQVHTLSGTVCWVLDAVLRELLKVAVCPHFAYEDAETCHGGWGTHPRSQVWIWLQGCLLPQTKLFTWCHVASSRSPCWSRMRACCPGLSCFALSPSTEPYFHCVCLFELNREDEWWELVHSGFSREICLPLLTVTSQGNGLKVRKVPSPQNMDLALADINPRLPGREARGTPTNHLDPHLQSFMMLSHTSQWKATLLTITEY